MSPYIAFLIVIQKRRAVIIDLCIAIGIPIIVMALRKHSSPYYPRELALIVLCRLCRPGCVLTCEYSFLNMLSSYAGHRFDILEDVGCNPSIYNTLPAYFLVFMWPTVLGCASFVFSCEFARSLVYNILTSWRKR